MQCACAILSSVACLTVQYFSTFSHKRHDFRKKKSYWIWNVCFDSLCNFCLKHFSFSEDLWSKMCTGLHVKYPVIRVTFQWNLRNLIFLYTFWKNTQISNFKKIRPEGAELFHSDIRTNRHDEPNNFFHNFGNAPKNWTYCIFCFP